MDTVLTLISDPAAPAVTEAVIAKAVSALEQAGADVGNQFWLQESVAMDIDFEWLRCDLATQTVREALAGEKVDVFAQAKATRRKRMLIADMDSTTITVECIDELADFAGVGNKVAHITERAMRGELDFKEALRERVKMIEGLGEDKLQQCYDERIRLMPGAKALVQTMKANGGMAALVSGGFTFFTARVAEAAGYDVDQANTLILEGGKLTGEVGEPILDRDAKLAALKRYCREWGLQAWETLAVGDGANDLDMVQAAGLGVAYHAKPIVAKAAPARVDHGDLTALLFMQGYRAEDFVG